MSFMNFLSILLAAAFVRCVTAEVYTAVADIEQLLEKEDHLMHSLEDYIVAEESRLGRLRIYLEEFRNGHPNEIQSVEEYTKNPINSFRLIKRLTANWQDITWLIENGSGNDFLNMVNEYQSTQQLPTEEDLNGAVTALVRLQDTYNINSSAMADGHLYTVDSGVKLLASDCFELGRQCFNNEDFNFTLDWMSEATKRLTEEVHSTVTMADILEYVAYATFLLGNITHALNVTHEVLRLNPNHEDALHNAEYFESLIKKGETSRSVRSVELTEEEMESEADGHLFRAACRGEMPTTTQITSQLKCRLFTRGHPYLLIGPLKVEAAYLDPEILIFHEVIYDREIKTIQRLAKSKLERAQVAVPPENGGYASGEFRISKVAWLSEDDDECVAAVERRAEYMTGLITENTELLQVANYGIGGHYVSHYDFALASEVMDDPYEKFWNRIATVLFYMSDVEAGGHTVFPKLGVSVKPIKGTAVFWMNLLPSGEGDERTLHGACPVVMGSKFVSNKWINVGWQWARRKCGLTEDARDPPIF